MAYEPTEWEAGMKVTASRLNKIEQGIVDAGGVMIVHENEDTSTLDKTFAEIRNALAVGTIVIFLQAYTDGVNIRMVKSAINEEGSYNVYFMNGPTHYTAASENGYPALPVS